MNNKSLKTSAIMFILWGILHLYAGLGLAIPYWSSGAGSMWAMFGYNPEKISGLLEVASHVALNFGIDLAGYGLLAIILAIFIFKNRYVKYSFWILVVMLGIADLAFVYALLIPGYLVSIVAVIASWSGPILYILGVAFGLVAFYSGKKSQRPKE
ncbi:MAG: hypothetical protein ACO2ZM_02030 [Francisellaceae bacterium]